MAKNTGNGHRKGIVGNRTQTYNSKTNKFIKRDATTGKFMSSKDTPYKNIRKEGVAKKEVDKKAKN